MINKMVSYFQSIDPLHTQRAKKPSYSFEVNLKYQYLVVGIGSIN